MRRAGNELLLLGGAGQRFHPGAHPHAGLPRGDGAGALEDRRRRREATEALLRLLATGEIKPVISARLPLSEAARAHTLIESGQVLGKLVLKP